MNNSTNSSSIREVKLEVAQIYEEKERRRRLNPLKFAVQHDKQKEASESLKAIRVLFWGNRVGKTEWGAQEVAKYALGEHPLRNVYPPVEIWCACPSFDQQRETTQKKLEMYIPQHRIVDTTFVKKNCWGEIVLDNGSRINFKSYEQGREKFQGVGKRLIWFDEEPQKDIWDECFVRQEAGMQLDIIFTMTAIKGMTWVYDRIYLDTCNPDLFISSAGWDDNPWLTEEQKTQMSRGLSAESLLVRREGRFVKRVGLVCSWWDRNAHIRHYDQLDPSWAWYEVLDGGFSDPAAWLLIGIDNDDSAHVVSGFRETGLSADQIKSHRDNRVGGLTIISGWIDNDNPRLSQDLGLKGMRLNPVEKAPGSAASWDEALAEKLSTYGQIQPGTGKPRLYISDTLMQFDAIRGENINWLVQEIENLVWLEKDNAGELEIKPQWDDHRRYGHHFDGVRALSYFLMSYKRAPEPLSAVVGNVRIDPYE